MKFLANWFTNKSFDFVFGKNNEHEDDKQRRRLLCVVAAVFVAFMCTVYMLHAALASVVCKAKWSGAYKSEYQLIGGCMVLANGRYVPADSIRN